MTGNMVTNQPDFFSVWRINVRDQSLTREPIPESWQHLGGRGLSARILAISNFVEIDLSYREVGMTEE